MNFNCFLLAWIASNPRYLVCQERVSYLFKPHAIADA